MKILQVSDSFYPFKGGVAEHIFHLSLELARFGHDVTILTTNYPKNMYDESEKSSHSSHSSAGDRELPRSFYPGSTGEVSSPFSSYSLEGRVNIIRLGRVLILPPLRIFNYSNITVTITNPLHVRQFLQKNHFDIIHTHGPFTFNLPQMALHYSEACNIATFHTKYVGFNWNKLFKLFFGNCAKKIYAAIHVSKTAYETASIFGFRKNFIIPNGIDLDRFTPDGPKISFNSSKPVVLFVGRLEKRKGLEILLEATKVLDVELIVVGNGPLKSRYMKMAPRARFFGEVPPEDLPKFYRAADVFVAPSTGGESFGIVLLEAMASGVPVIASDIEGYRNVIKHRKNGLLFEPENPESLKNQLFEVLKKPELRNNLINEGLRTAKKFSWSLIVKQVEKIYKTCLKEGKKWQRKNFPVKRQKRELKS